LVMKVKRLNKGFTLIELLVVIAIIGVLSTVVLSNVGSARSKGANTNIKSNLANARAQAELFFINNSETYNGGVPASNVCSSDYAQDLTTKSVRSFVQAAHAQSVATAISFLSGTPQPNTGITVCHAISTAWAASVPLKVAEGTNLYWCVDSKGFAGGRINPLGGATVCPAN
jgi:prepilin-type N-terminal cleavage/methylation domain-containing protein